MGSADRGDFFSPPVAAPCSTIPPMFPVVTLTKDLGRILRQGHPWVYRDALDHPSTLRDGDFVSLAGKDGKPFAHGFWSATSPIALRILSLHPVADPRDLVRQRLAASLATRKHAFAGQDTNAFRWVHGEGDRLPGIHVDVYADVATVRFDGAGSRAFYADLERTLRDIAGLRKVVDREQRTRESDEVEVRENGLRFLVDLGLGQKGGLFLDQRENRALVETMAGGKRVLNLFGYTGAFSLYAARGGAVFTDTVDIAAPAMTAARRNFTLNGFPLENAGFHAMDAFVFLERAVAEGVTYDLVISDPPSFAPSKKSFEAARRTYRRLHQLVARVTTPGGIACMASCSSHFPKKEFLSSVAEGVHQAGRRWTLNAFAGAGLDHPSLPVFPEGDYLKFAVGIVS
jgi:23S rRNA (cytosine1962-C5)-methyltransferase